jgi:hypothetical protein
MDEEEKSTYRRTEPNGIDRLFLSLSTIYGKRWFDMWAGVDEQALKITWVRGLKGLEAYQVRDALDYCADGHQTFVPDLPSFRRICDQMKKAEVVKSLQRKFTPEELQKNSARMRSVMADLGGAKGNKEWARKILANPKAYPDIAVRFAQEALND